MKNRVCGSNVHKTATLISLNGQFHRLYDKSFVHKLKSPVFFSFYRTVLHIIQVVVCRTVLRITSADFDTTATAQVVFPRPELYFSETATI